MEIDYTSFCDKTVKKLSTSIQIQKDKITTHQDKRPYNRLSLWSPAQINVKNVRQPDSLIILSNQRSHFERFILNRNQHRLDAAHFSKDVV